MFYGVGIKSMDCQGVGYYNICKDFANDRREYSGQEVCQGKMGCLAGDLRPRSRQDA